MTQTSVFFLAVCLLYLVVFGEASIAKLREGEVPDWFRQQFADTWLGKLPVGPQYRMIMVLELVVAGLFVAALVTGEPWAEGAKTLMGWGLLLASAVFSMLCFGQRVSFDFAGAASSFVYSGITLVLWFLVAMGGA